MKQKMFLSLLLCLGSQAFGMRVGQKAARQSLALIQKRNIRLNEERDLPELMNRFGSPECFKLLEVFDKSDDLRSIRNHLVEASRMYGLDNDDKWLISVQQRYLDELITKADEKEREESMEKRFGKSCCKLP